MSRISTLDFISLLENPEVILLESQLQGHPSSKRSFLAIGHQAKMTARGEKIIIEKKNEDAETAYGNPWEVLKKFRNEHPGWHFGYFGYDLRNDIENLQNTRRIVSDLPDLMFIKPELLAEIRGEELEWIYGDEQAVMEVIAAHTSDGAHKPLSADIHPGITRSAYIKKVQDVKQRIKEGDFYELNLSYPMEGTFRGNPFQLYQQLKRVNPVPFGAYLSVEGAHVCCASPERFLKKEGTKLLSEPIKGTSARSDDPDTDQMNREELLNEKNRAENLMIVDLVRHDLAKIAITGSVKVEKLFDLQSFGTVHQLISSISCEVDNRLDPADYIQACFPMGSMTGAPKIEVMKHIQRLEEYKRGIYSGAIGYFTPDHDFDFNVVIRTAIINNEKLNYPVGGAITSDSDPELEWKETLLKAKSLYHAIGQPSAEKR